MDFKIGYAVNFLLFGEANIEMAISNNFWGNSKYYANHFVEDISEFTKRNLNIVVPLVCVKAALEKYKSSHSHYYEENAKDEDSHYYAAIGYYKNMEYRVKIEMLEARSYDYSMKEAIDLAYELTDKLRIPSSNSIVIHLGSFYDDIIKSVFNGKKSFRANTSTIKQYYGKEPNNETLLCNLV